MQFLVPLGRLLFSAVFLLSGPNHFKQSTIDYAASQGIPLAKIAVPLSGVIALLGAISIILGWYARVGALLVILFLIPVSFSMHNFWAVHDPQASQMQMIHFMKNMSMLGGALLIAYHGAGPVSIDKGMKR
ncbi:MAG TPA: DoxX family protein [Tepidisphaeraceae bacterium]|jgi:putative oxidoreductase|nr:DoxX family protein [Tepidisphaeraceae bacterium]